MTVATRKASAFQYRSTLTNALPTSLASLIEGRYSVRLWGAKGDGAANDQVALKNAIGAQLPLYWPRGVYRITQDIGEAGDLSHSTADLDWYGDGATIFLDTETQQGRMARILIGARNATIRGITFDGNHIATQCLRIENNSASMADENIGEIRIENSAFNNARRIAGADGGDALLIRGGFKRVALDDVAAKDCRLAAGAGISGTVGIGGITITHFGATGFVKEVQCSRLLIDKVYSEDPEYTADQDGIKVFCPSYVAFGSMPENSISITHSKFRNCNGRSIKSQGFFVVGEDLTFYRDTGLAQGNPEIDSQRGGGQFSNIRALYKGAAPSSLISSSFEEPADDPLVTPPRWATSVEDVQVVLEGVTMVKLMGSFPRGGYVGPVSVRDVHVFGECRELVEMLVNGNDNDCVVERCSISELSAYPTSGNRALVRVRANGGDTPFASRVAVRDCIYRGSETAYAAEGSITGTAATATVTASGNVGFAGNTPP